jgi:hypothetical protein
MTKLMTAVTLGAAVVVASVAVAQRPSRLEPSDAAVQAVIDARLHQLLKQLNAKRR